MKDKIIVFIIGLLAGAIIATSAFLIYAVVTSKSNDAVGGQMQQMGDGQTPPDMQNGDGQTPPEKPDGDTNESGQTPPEKTDGNTNGTDTQTQSTDAE